VLVNRKDIDKILKKFKDEIQYQLDKRMRKYPREIQLIFGELYDEGADHDYIIECLGIASSTLTRWHRIYLKEPDEEENSLDLEDEPHDPIDEDEAEVNEFKQNILEWLEDKTGTPPMLWEAPEGYRLVSVCESQMKRLMKGVTRSPVDELLEG